MKTRDELNKMTKQAIINLIESNELLNKVDGLNSISLGTVMFVEDVGKQLADKSHMFHGIINSTVNEDGDLVITMPALAAPVKCLAPSQALIDHVAESLKDSHDNSAKRESVEDVPCKVCGRTDLPLHFNRACPECFTPDIVKFEC